MPWNLLWMIILFHSSGMIIPPKFSLCMAFLAHTQLTLEDNITLCQPLTNEEIWNNIKAYSSLQGTGSGWHILSQILGWGGRVRVLVTLLNIASKLDPSRSLPRWIRLWLLSYPRIIILITWKCSGWLVSAMSFIRLSPKFLFSALDP